MSWFSSWASLSLPSSTPTVDVLSYTVLAAGFPPETVDKTRELGVKRKLDNTAVYAETSDAMHKSFCAGAEWHHGFGGTYIEVGYKSCLYRVAWPRDQEPAQDISVPIYDGRLASVYPFELDLFQRTSIACLEYGMQLSSPARVPHVT